MKRAIPVTTLFLDIGGVLYGAAIFSGSVSALHVAEPSWRPYEGIRCNEKGGHNGGC